MTKYVIVVFKAFTPEKRRLIKIGVAVEVDARTRTGRLHTESSDFPVSLRSSTWGVGHRLSGNCLTRESDRGGPLSAVDFVF